MPADSLVHLRGLDSRETLIEAAAVLSVAIQDPDFIDALDGVYEPAEIGEILGFFSLRMPSIIGRSFDVAPEYLLGECLKVVEASDIREVPLTAALMSLNLYSLGRLGPVADVAVRALWHKLLNPVLDFLRAACCKAADTDEEDFRPRPPVMALPEESPFSWDPHDRSLLADHTMWARGIGPMFHSIAGWNSVWTMPPRPRLDLDEGSWQVDGLERQTAYWSPLAQLVLGPLGWTDPALGIARWILRGMPTTETPMRFLAEVWGTDALMFFCTSRDWVPMIEEAGIFTVGVAGAGLVYSSSRRKQRLIGYGEYHLGQHLAWQMFDEWTSNPVEPERSDEIFRSGNVGSADAALMLKRFAGWYRNLELVGEALPDGSKVHLVAPPAGYLGVFRRDSRTRRWHSASTLVHRWGTVDAHSRTLA